ncbi:MAG: alpha/beta hydrolase [Myxococcales bacterium]|nr:alpha/beta hydrolase [Myxococcales bacterium]
MQLPYDANPLGVHPRVPRAVVLLIHTALVLGACEELGSERVGAQTGSEGRAAPTSPEPSPGATTPAPAQTPVPPTSGVVVLAGPPPEVPSCFLPTPVHHPDWVRARNRVFARADGQDLALDVFRAPGEEPKPAIVLLHGGGWRAGERAHVNEPARAFARLGYAAVPVSYRLVDVETGTGRFPAPVNDVRCAVRYLRVHADELGIDPARIGVLGFSAGGHLASMVATASDEASLEPECPITESSPAVQVAVSFYGAHDLNARFGSGARALIAAFLGPANSVERRAAASPITYVDRTDPPLLLVHGARDTVVPIDQSRRMYARLLEEGVQAQLVEVREGLHGFSIFREGRHPRASCTSLRFLAEHLRPVTPPPRNAPGRPRGARVAPVDAP